MLWTSGVILICLCLCLCQIGLVVLTFGGRFPSLVKVDSAEGSIEGRAGQR